MKHTECKICGRNLESMTYDKMMAHANKHASSNINQKQLGDFENEVIEK